MLVWHLQAYKGMAMVIVDGLKKYGRFIQMVNRMTAAVRELQRASECLRAASDIEIALFYSVLALPTLFCNKVIVFVNAEQELGCDQKSHLHIAV